MLTVRTLAPNELVSEPGVYSMSMETYHGQPCIGPSVSSTGVRTVLPPKSPAHFWASWSGNQDSESYVESQAMVRGRLAHHLLLGEAGFNSAFVIRPDAWSDWRTDAARRWRNKQLLTGKTVVEPEKVEDVRSIALSLSRHPLVMAGALNGEIERSLIWQDQETGLWCKARPDAIPTDGGDFVDLKLTADLDYDALQRTIGTYGYHIQGAMIGLAAREVLDLEMQSFTLFFTEHTRPHAVRAVELDAVDLALGMKQLRAGLRLIADCYDKGQWPGPGGISGQSDTVKISLKPWDRTRFENDVTLINQELGQKV